MSSTLFQWELNGTEFGAGSGAGSTARSSPPGARSSHGAASDSSEPIEPRGPRGGGSDPELAKIAAELAAAEAAAGLAARRAAGGGHTSFPGHTTLPGVPEIVTSVAWLSDTDALLACASGALFAWDLAEVGTEPVALATQLPVGAVVADASPPAAGASAVSFSAAGVSAATSAAMRAAREGLGSESGLTERGEGVAAAARLALALRPVWEDSSSVAEVRAYALLFEWSHAFMRRIPITCAEACLGGLEHCAGGAWLAVLCRDQVSQKAENSKHRIVVLRA